MGRSRGGLTAKVHALVDTRGLPIGLKLTEGQAHDGRSADDMLDGLGEGCILLDDRARDSDAIRAALAARGAWACVKPVPGRVRIQAISPFLYRYRNLVERFFSKLQHFRAVATRYDKHDDNFLASYQPEVNLTYEVHCISRPIIMLLLALAQKRARASGPGLEGVVRRRNIGWRGSLFRETGGRRGETPTPPNS